jgi:hypothetical protein
LLAPVAEKFKPFCNLAGLVHKMPDSPLVLRTLKTWIAMAVVMPLLTQGHEITRSEKCGVLLACNHAVRPGTVGHHWLVGGAHGSVYKVGEDCWAAGDGALGVESRGSCNW